MPTPAQSSSTAEASSRAAVKPPRVLACVLCQQRKVKCTKKFPCENCVRAGVQCVPAAQGPRPRRRRFPERELLERLRRYEDLLRQNKIKYDHRHPPGSEAGKDRASRHNALPEGMIVEPDRPLGRETAAKSETVYETK